MSVLVLLQPVAFYNKRKVYVLSGIYVNPLLHNNENVKYDFRFSLDISGVGEKVDIL